MKNLYRISLFSLIISCSMLSCTKDLNLDPVSQISNASFWKTENDANGGLYGMYVRFRGQAQNNLFLWGEARSEVMNRSLAALNGYNYYYDNALDRTNSGPTWQGMYTVVHDANLLLKYVPGIKFSSEASKNAILAQAYTMRAYVYFTMVKTWGDLPLVTEPIEGFSADAIQKERTSKTELFKFIKQDLDAALSLYSANTFSPGRSIWSKPAANALKADVYLWTAKRENGGRPDLNVALAALNDAQTGDVGLLDNYASIFDYGNKGNREILMAVRFQDVEATSTIFSDMYMSSAFMTNNTDAATKALIGAFGGNPYWTVSNGVRAQFTADDLRKQPSFIEIYTTTGTYYGSIVYKFKGTVIGGARQFLDDVILYRYADILLMKAEVKNALGQDPADEINLVRKRAYGTKYNDHVFVNGTDVQNDEAILKERLLELAFEGKRWWDLVRFGKAFEKVPSLQDRAGQNELLLFPISETTLSLEPKVKQNPGYK